MSAPMDFGGRLLFSSTAKARTAVAKLPGRAEHCVPHDDLLRVRGAQVDVFFENVIGSAFFESTLVALATLARQAFLGKITAVYQPGTKEAQREQREAGAAVPGGAKLASGTRWAIEQTLLGDRHAVAMAHGGVEPAEVPELVRVHDALTEPIQRARVARLFAGRTERESTRIVGDLASLRIDPADPWVDELHAIVAAPTPAASEDAPFLLHWIETQALIGQATRTAGARAKVTRTQLPALRRAYDVQLTLLERARLARVLIGRPAISRTPDVQAVLADLVARTARAGDPDGDEIRAIQAEATAARRSAKPKPAAKPKAKR